MLPIGCGVLGPPKMMATAKMVTTKPRQIRRTRFTASNYNSTKLRFVYFGLIEEGLWIKRKHEFFVARI
jgi:hypothetical protein